jgi:DNA-binding CsgD family transcriptional regulator
VPEQLIAPAVLADLPTALRAASDLVAAERVQLAYAQCGIVIEVAQHWRVLPALAAALSLRSAVGRSLGELAGSVQDAVAAGVLLDQLGADRHGGPALLLLARHVSALVDVGDHAGADQLLERAELAGELPDTQDGLALTFARGRLHLAAGRPGAALPDLFRCGERLAAWHADRPSVLPWRSAAATALWHSGAHEAAARLAEAEVELARDAGTTGALGAALRVHGVVLTGAAGLPAMEESARVLDGSPLRLELAATLVAYGTRLNELKRRPQARRVLRAGLDLAERCGSRDLVDRARTQYAVAGGRLRPALPTGVSGLTAAERRAVALAAADRTNRQIAEELFLSVRTVEIHLTNAYRKLGVARRSELAAALAAADAEQA